MGKIWQAILDTWRNIAQRLLLPIIEGIKEIWQLAEPGVEVALLLLTVIAALVLALYLIASGLCIPIIIILVAVLVVAGVLGVWP